MTVVTPPFPQLMLGEEIGLKKEAEIEAEEMKMKKEKAADCHINFINIERIMIHAD